MLGANCGCEFGRVPYVRFSYGAWHGEPDLLGKDVLSYDPLLHFPLTNAMPSHEIEFTLWISHTSAFSRPYTR